MPDARRAIDYAEACLEVKPTQKEASGIVTKLKQVFGFPEKKAFYQIYLFGVVTISDRFSGLFLATYSKKSSKLTGLKSKNTLPISKKVKEVLLSYRM